MPISVQYGPIAAGLQAAQMAGAGQGFNIQAQRDLAALQLQNQMQETINRNNASEMQNAFAYDQLNSQNQIHQQQLAQQGAYENADLALKGQQNKLANQLREDQLNQHDQEFQSGQATRDEQAKSLAALRQAQTDKLNAGPDQTGNTIRANGDVLRSMDTEASKTQGEIQRLTSALAKASDPYTGDQQQADAIRQQLNGLKTTLDGIDPATGKKVGVGLNDKRNALRQTLQQYGKNLRPDSILKQNDNGGFDVSNEEKESGIDHNDPLYKTNVMNVSGPPQGNTQPVGGQQGGQQVTPQMIAQLGQQIAQQLNAPINDPRVAQMVRQHLTSQGFQIPTIQ